METIVTVVCAVIGSGSITAVTNWLLNRFDHEKAIAKSPTIRRLELELYRQTLFMPTTDRTMQEHQLEVGAKYLELGGNGRGHARYNQLEQDYERRLEAGDWTYRP